MYSWKAFVTGLVVSEMPYLIICAGLYFCTFYFTACFSSEASKAGPSFLMMLLYELLYTGIGQFIAAYTPTVTAAALVNPVFIFTMVGYCGVFVPYKQIVDGLRYWLYWINPFNYLMGGLLVFPNWNIVVECSNNELALFTHQPTKAVHNTSRQIWQARMECQATCLTLRLMSPVKDASIGTEAIG